VRTSCLASPFTKIGRELRNGSGAFKKARKLPIFLTRLKGGESMSGLKAIYMRGKWGKFQGGSFYGPPFAIQLAAQGRGKIAKKKDEEKGVILGALRSAKILPIEYYLCFIGRGGKKMRKRKSRETGVSITRPQCVKEWEGRSGRFLRKIKT